MPFERDDGTIVLFPWRFPALLRELHHERGLTQLEIAEEFQCPQSTVSNWMDRHNIRPRRRGPRPARERSLGDEQASITDFES